MPYPAPATRTELLEPTARLSLATARQVRSLCSIACRTSLIADATPYGCAIATIANHEKEYADNSLALTWALIMLAISELPPAGVPSEITDTIRDHIHCCTCADQLKDHVWECQLARAWSGTATI
jgi:hypothetical protein